MFIFFHIFFYWQSTTVDNQEDVEQMVYLTSPDCLKAKKPLVQFDLYVGTMVFSYPRNDRRSLPTQFPIKMFHNQQDRISSPMQQNYLYFDPINKNCNTFTSSNTSSKIGLNNNENDDELISFDIENESQPNRFKNAPNCSEYPLNDFSMTSFEHLPVSLFLKKEKKRFKFCFFFHCSRYDHVKI